MGAVRIFRCEGCGYEAEIGGGLDFGLTAATWTVHCLDCRELRDFVVSNNLQEVSGKDWKPKFYRCMKNSKHRVELWSDPGPCPRCGKTLTGWETTLLWD
jgi:hypothetical protein